MIPRDRRPALPRGRSERVAALPQPNRGHVSGGPISKLNQIRTQAEGAMIYDGFQVHDGKQARINARHNKRKYTNFLFADGHAESVETARLLKTNTEFASARNLVAHPYPKWRLDQ